MNTVDKAFIGRQPIFDKSLAVYGYELLFRSNELNAADFRDGDHATANVLLSAFTDIGLNDIVGNKPAFVNLTRNLLIQRQFACLPPNRVVLEILEDIEPDDQVVAAIEDLKNQGFTIALDDFVYRPELERLLPLADIVKIDLPCIDDDELPEHIVKIREHGVPLILAEKIETQEEFLRCSALGCDLFQGYFFCKPQVLHRKRIGGNILAAIRLISALQQPDISTADVEKIIQTDADLSYKLLRFVNSASAATVREIDSLRQATALMGIDRLRSLASMMLLSNVDPSKPVELITMAMLRAKTCEFVAEDMRLLRPGRYYTLGLLSLMDAILDQPMPEVIRMLPLAEDLNQALVHRTGELGHLLDAVVAHEKNQTTESNEFTPLQIAAAYQRAIKWTITVEEAEQTSANYA